MKTLSDDLTLSVATTDMQEGYVITSIYANGIGVFSGQSYIPGDGDPLYINVNDFASQNDAKNDYVKLDDTGNLVTLPLIEDRFGTYDTEYRFVRGQVATYMVRIDYGQVHSQNSETVLCGYDYENKDLRPRFLWQDQYPNAWNSSLCRIMTGCNWIWNPENEIGSFTNLIDGAEPHYPFVKTDKYGIGLQIWRDGDVYTRAFHNTKFALHTTTGNDVNIGVPIFVTSNMTFITLDDFITMSNANEEYDSSIYLKLYGTSGDEFGDWEEGYGGYYGTLRLDSLTVYGDKAHGTINIGTFSSGAQFNDYLLRYMQAQDTGWDYNALVNGEKIVYTTEMKRWEAQVTSELNNKEQSYPIVGVSPKASESEYFSIVIQPNFSQRTYSDEVPSKFIGTCLVGILDRCPARYYLAWNDRYGDIQSQAFDGKIEFSENIKTDEIMDYKERRRVSHKAVQPKWKLNTKWLKEDVYPIYESIYTSPYLLLYDTEQDKAWNVIITDSEYKEKTNKNEKTLFNLEITVESNKTQEKTY